MKRLVIALAALAMLATAIPANAQNCYLKCVPNGQGGQNCYQMCSP